MVRVIILSATTLAVGAGRRGHVFYVPVRGFRNELLPLPLIQHFIHSFKAHAWWHLDERFEVLVIACNKREYKPNQIAPFFDHSPPNVSLPYEFLY